MKKRLTDNEFHTSGNKERVCYIQEPRLQAIYDKLFDLEDIEEELGIDLVTLIKALRDGIYIKPNNIYCGSPYLCYSENEHRDLEMQFRVADVWYKVKDYGKTWALVKEKLENEIHSQSCIK